MRIALIVVLMLALTLIGGCAKIAEKAAQSAVEKATGVKVDEKNQSVTVTGKDGAKVTYAGSDEGKLPDNLPSDFPVYQGTPEGNSASATTNDGSTWTFSVTTADKVKQVDEWYKDQLTNKGWTIESSSTITVNGVDSAVISAKKDKLEVMVSMGAKSEGSDQNLVGVILSEKAK